jgi:hypothetical protein
MPPIYSRSVRLRKDILDKVSRFLCERLNGDGPPTREFHACIDEQIEEVFCEIERDTLSRIRPDDE